MASDREHLRPLPPEWDRIHGSLILLAARLVRGDALPSDLAEDWPARPTGASVARRMERTRDIYRGEASDLRRLTDTIRALVRSLLAELDAKANEVAVLAGELDEARRILRRLEWSGWTHLCEDEGRDGCPECKSFKAGSLSEADIVDFGVELRDYEGRHDAGCELGALLARLEAKP